MTVIGAVYASYQVLVGRIARELGAGESEMALLIASVFSGAALIALVMGEISERVGKRVGIISALLLSGAGAFIVSLSGSVAAAAVGLAMSGFGIGGCETITMSLVEDNNPDTSDRVMCFVMAMFGLGGFAAPMAVSALVPDGEFRAVFLFFGAVQLAMFGLHAGFRDIDRFGAVQKGQRGLAAARLLKSPRLVLAMAALFIYVGVESVITYWAGELFTAFGSAQSGAAAVSAYWLAVAVGALLSSRLKNPARLLPLLLILGAGCILCVVFVGEAVLKVCAMFAVGLLFGPAYAVICYIGGHSSREHSAAAYSLMGFAGSVGGIVLQPAVAAVSAGSSLGTVYILAAALTVLDAATVVAAARRAPREGHA